jgi:tyrosinase
MANGTMRTRRDVWTLQQPWDPVIEWYARGIAAMQARPITDPLSWRYQAAIHGYHPDVDPYSQPGETLPEFGEIERYWNQCQHSSWFFLPWHRVYLGIWERILGDAIVQLGGPADWALPYWNYSDSANPDARRLPPAFMAATLPDGTPNPLNLEPRFRMGVDANGDVPLDESDVSLDCLRDSSFTLERFAGVPAFGGPITLFNHGGGPTGSLERTPHGNIHVAVGGFDDNGNAGLMSQFETAGLDPVFWMHHANIDRLWDVWLGRAGSGGNPSSLDWLNATGARFEFRDHTGAAQTYAPADVLDSKAAPFHYAYDTVADPLPVVVAGPLPGPVLESRTTRGDAMAELVGATKTPIPLSSPTTRIGIELAQPRGPALEARGTRQQKVYLNLSNITAKRPAARIKVYLGAGGGEPREEDLAGTLPMFGVESASKEESAHGGSGLSYVLDITAIVERLKQQRRWNPERLDVSFVARDRLGADVGLQVGSVSVHYE